MSTTSDAPDVISVDFLTSYNVINQQSYYSTSTLVVDEEQTPFRYISMTEKHNLSSFSTSSKHHVEQEICPEIHQKHKNRLQTHHIHPLQSSTVKTVGCCLENKGRIVKNHHCCSFVLLVKASLFLRMSFVFEEQVGTDVTCIYK